MVNDYIMGYRFMKMSHQKNSVARHYSESPSGLMWLLLSAAKIERIRYGTESQ